MIDKTKVEKSEAKAAELEKKVCIRNKKKLGYIFLSLSNDYDFFWHVKQLLRYFESVEHTVTVPRGNFLV